MCTNTSRPPSSGLMNPYPRSPLKNLTVPVIDIGITPLPVVAHRRPHARRPGRTFADRKRHRPRRPQSLHDLRGGPPRCTGSRTSEPRDTLTYVGQRKIGCVSLPIGFQTILLNGRRHNPIEPVAAGGPEKFRQRSEHHLGLLGEAPRRVEDDEPTTDERTVV